MSRTTELLKKVRERLTAATSDARREIGELRDAIKRTRAELAHAQRAPLPVDEVRARIAEAVRQVGAGWLAKNGMTLVHGEDSVAAWRPKYRGRLPFLPGEGLPFGLLCCARPDETAALLGDLFEQVPYEAGPPAAARPTLIERLERELADLETTEETAIDAAAEAGVVIAHRSEVVQRRASEARAREREEQEVADRAKRQEALDTEHDSRIRGRFVHPEPHAGL